MRSFSRAKNLQILEAEEIEQLYALPSFEPKERIMFFTLSSDEYDHMRSYRGVSSKVFFIMQLGYFKAKHLFFVFEFEQRLIDTRFILKQYFPHTSKEELRKISKPTRLNQRQKICTLLGYRPVKEDLLPELMAQASEFAKRHNHPVYLFRSLLQHLHNKKIIVPAYSFLQRQIISQTIQNERQRLAKIIDLRLDDKEKALLDDLLEKPDTGMYPFTWLQKEPSSFKYYQLRGQLRRSELIAPIYKIVMRIRIELGISHENIRYYGSIAQDYKVFNLKNLKGNMRYIYLLCFAYNRYRSINDILVEGFRYHVWGLEKSAGKFADKQISIHQLEAHESLSKVPRVLALFEDKTIPDQLLFKQVRKMAFAILSPKGFQLVSQLIHKNRLDKKELTWLFYQYNKRLISLYLRPLGIFFELDNHIKCENLIEALDFIKDIVGSKKYLTKVPPGDFPCTFLSKKRKQYILNEEGNVASYKYEMALYQALRSKLEAGDIFVLDSFLHRSFDDDLLAKKDWKSRKPAIIKQVDLLKLDTSVHDILEQWKQAIEPLYERVNDRIKKSLNPSIQIDGKDKDGSTKWHHVYTETSPPLNHKIYRQFKSIGIEALLQFVDQKTQFLGAFTHSMASHVSRRTDKDQLIACLVAFGTNYGIGKMAGICDISFQELSRAADSLIYLQTLKEANRRIVNQTRELPMFQHYHLQPGVVHSSSDGQKYYTQIPTINARYSNKYFGLSKGIVSLTAVANHVPFNTELTGANEHESHYVFDLLYNNITDIKPEIHSTDSHGINQVNFAILDMFGYRFAPRYKNISSKAKTIYSFKNPDTYKDYLIKPIRKFKTELITQQWDTFQRIIASLALKTTTQSTIIKKLASYKRNNIVQKAIVEYDNIVETYHKLSYLDDPKFQKQIHTAINRGEHVNKLRKHLFHVDGGKFKVHTVMEQRIWSECNLILANAVVFYNTYLLSELLAFHQKKGNTAEIELIKKVSPIAWQHIHIHGRYTFRLGKLVWDVMEMVKKIKL